MLSSSEVVCVLISYFHYNSAFTSEAPHGRLQINTLIRVTHTSRITRQWDMTWCTIDYYANSWKNTYPRCTCNRITSLQHASAGYDSPWTGESSLLFEHLSTVWSFSYFSLLPTEKHLPCLHLYWVCFKMGIIRQACNSELFFFLLQTLRTHLRSSWNLYSFGLS